ncbi:shikimate kinase [Persephonella sp.]
MKNIYLVGFMGSGKSTAGKLVAQRLGMEFVDIDSVIEEREGMEISRIFAEKGERYFREREREIIREMGEKTGLVVSTGGGLGADRSNMEFMKKTGVVFWLDVPLEEILKRTEGDDTRPLLKQPLEDLKKLYEERKKVYSLAHRRITAWEKTPEEIAGEIVDGYLHRD